MRPSTAVIATSLCAILALAACRDQRPAPDPGVIIVPEAEGDASRVPVPDSCGAESWTHVIGRHTDRLDIANLPSPARIIGPDSAVTMDFLPNRLNIRHGEDGIITDITCG
jgi:hypothetical protein